MRNTRKQFSLLCAYVGFISAFAQESAPLPFQASVNDVRIWGGGAKLEYSGLRLVPDLETALVLQAGAGWEDRPISRDLETGDSLFTQETAFEGQSYQSPNMQWDFLVTQSLPSPRKGIHPVLFSGYRGRFDTTLEPGNASRFADRNGLFQNSFMAGAGIDTVETTKRTVKSGISGELAAEYAPGALSAGKSDFYRVTTTLCGFLPVMEAIDGKTGAAFASSYLAARIMIDHSDGPHVPMFVQQGFGGRKIVSSFGGSAVRGYGDGQFDTSLKAAATAELRILGPSLFGIENLVPALFVFLDAGRYSGYSGSSTMGTASGYALSAGAGAAMQLFGFAQPSCAVAFPLTEEDDNPFSPNLSFRFKFPF